jgi:N-acetylglutamate synthase-like GNAT family acetyltransferase
MSEIPGVEIVEYSDEYKEPIKDLIFNVYEVETGRYARGREGRPDLNAIRETYQDDAGNFWVAVEKGKVIGTIGLMNQGKDKASMHRFCVAKDFRGKEKGVSAKLYSTLLGFAANKGYKKIFLGTTPDAKAAIKFYERNGFIKIDSLPEDMAKSSFFSNCELLYELDLEEEK